jgi:predicted 3-demethylubiquinone-9 3-methyltransferase (glyoxalase superfamily)
VAYAQAFPGLRFFYATSVPIDHFDRYICYIIPVDMQKIVTFLWFNDQAEEAAKLYTSIFKNSSIKSISYYKEGTPGLAGKAMSVIFELEGQEFFALNGGPMFTFNPSISLFVNCESQQEVDDLWSKLIANGGEPSRCGWLKDRYGLSWQIIPTVLNRLLNDGDPGRAQRAFQAMMKMDKLDIAALQAAADNT